MLSTLADESIKLLLESTNTLPSLLRENDARVVTKSLTALRRLLEYSELSRLC